LFHFAGRKKTGALTMIGHLGMSGAFFVVDKNAPLLPHTHLRFLLARPQGELRYVDPRRFGSLRVVKNSEVAETLDLGPDPFSAAFTPTDFHAALLASQQTLKTLLLDQHTVAGLGNIYVAEALFLAGLSPQRRGHAVSAKEAHRLHGVIVSVLSEAIARRGTTLSDGGYVDAEGKEGENQHHLFVYDRGGAPCRQCQTPIERIVQAQRSTYFCPHCQT
jgi:formamidopyrimidine-DNA glycosylase